MLNQDTDIHEILEQGVLRYQNLGKLYISGDFNGRSATDADLLAYDKYIDDEAFSDFIDRDSLTKRVNQDNVIDSYGRRLLFFCQMTNLLIANGRLGDFRNTSGFTFASHNGLSIVDYLLCGIEDSQYIKYFSILNFYEFSDHSPILCSLST